MVGTYRRNPVTSRSRHYPLPREAQLVPAGASVAIREGPLTIGFDWTLAPTRLLKTAGSLATRP